MRICRSFIVAGIFVLAGCVSAPVWKYDGRVYDTAESAQAAAKRDIKRILDQVRLRENPVADSMLIFTPSPSWSRRAVAVTGRASDEMIGYVAGVYYLGFHEIPDAVMKRGLFGKTDVREFDRLMPEPHAKYQYMLWLRMNDASSATWLISTGERPNSYKEIYLSPLIGKDDRNSAIFEAIEEYVKDNPPHVIDKD